MSNTRPARKKADKAANHNPPAERALPKTFPIVAIGASAGGLDACRKLLKALPRDIGMAFILVQHLDPHHESMLVELLSGLTLMPVEQATDRMRIEANHLYIIPPGSYLSATKGALCLSQRDDRHGARLPFDFLLHSLAAESGAKIICVILSGTGADGSLGLRSIKECGGYVIVQDPTEAEYDGMPQSAILTGAVDLVLPVEKIPEALVRFSKQGFNPQQQLGSTPQNISPDLLPEIIGLLRTHTTHDFTLYKKGTLQRRIERRMAMSRIPLAEPMQYLEMLRGNEGELDLLAKDLLINVTGFFRDLNVYDMLAGTIIPDLVRNHPSSLPLRIWIAGCSTGEEAYSIAMLFQEEILKAGSNTKLQIFASDVDADAVSYARDGIYPDTITADVSAARLTRFFSKEDHNYKVSSELRGMVVFTIQDVLTDPPFSRLDMISCRNLMIYLTPEAQAKIILLFHFALRKNGILLLGSSETIGDPVGRFEVISKQERLYRQIGRSRPSDIEFPFPSNNQVRIPPRSGSAQILGRQETLAELCRKLVTDLYAPAAVLINRNHECLYFLGPMDRYLRVAGGPPTRDLLLMARTGLRGKLRLAIQQALQENARIVLSCGASVSDDIAKSFYIIVQPVPDEGEALLLVCFIDQPPGQKSAASVAVEDQPRVAELEQELEAVRTELKGAIRALEVSNEDQKSINEEALSVNEEYQSTNEELLTSKEELQSLNEELTVLNSQLQETLERQRTTSDDLQNVLYSTDVATLFLDANLNIRFFTPATKALFHVIPGDVGRPLDDLHSFATDSALASDARSVLVNLTPIEREIETQDGDWFIRRILPYRTHDNRVEGVVITFTDVTGRRHTADALDAAKRQAETANGAKSRFLAAASHDLRQPLQTLVLLQGLLAKIVEGEKAQKLVARLDETMSAMAGMLNALLDINQIEAGTVHTERVRFPVNDLLYRLRDEFTYHAQAQKLELRMVPCSLTIESDPRLLEQMIRNLLSNAFKYTKEGKVLLGCRRRQSVLSIEIWDTGIGIPNTELQTIFEEYHQLDNAARDRNLGLGLGLSIVQRLGQLLAHPVRVRSQNGKGSVFTIEIPLTPIGSIPPGGTHGIAAPQEIIEPISNTGTILVIEDDPDVRSLLGLLLEEEGLSPIISPDGIAALKLLTREKLAPDLILSDYNLPNGMNGLIAAIKIKTIIGRDVPVLILTGDISTEALRDIGRADCAQLSKPVKPKELIGLIRQLLAETLRPLKAPKVQHIPSLKAVATSPTIFVVDDDPDLRQTIRAVLEEEGELVEDFESCEAFLEAYVPGRSGCLLLDAYLPGMSGLALLKQLHNLEDKLPVMMITGHSDVPTAVLAMKAGAIDFIEKPLSRIELLAAIASALEQARDATKLTAWKETAVQQVGRLTARQKEIMDLVLAGHPSKNIAADLGISQRTVENHRASIMKRTGSKSLPALARLAIAAASKPRVD